jgi:hypothetical protein
MTADKLFVVSNRAIEIHDSAIDQISLENGVAVIHFPTVYIHQSDGKPAMDAGTGWVQEAVLRIGDAQVEGAFSEEMREVSGYDVHYLKDGSIRIGDQVSDNLIPIPIDVTADIHLTLESWYETVRIRGTSCSLELLGEANYVEEFKP